MVGQNLDTSRAYRLGFAVKILGAGGLKTHDARRWQSGPHLSRSLELFDAVLAHLARIRVSMYRLSSSFVPYGTHPDLPELDFRRQIDACTPALERLAERVRAQRLRLSTHPGQYCVLNALDAAVAAKARADVEQDALLLDALGQGPEGVVVVHVGGVYGDRGQALERWVRSWELLSDRARRRVAVEHDERAFDLADALWIHQRTGVPVVFDSHHHRCNPGALPGVEAVALAYATWPEGVRPKVHVSSPRTALRVVGRGRSTKVLPPLLDQHADFVSPWDLADVLHAAPGPLDVMLEAKAKDLAVDWARVQLARIDQELSAAEEVFDKSWTGNGQLESDEGSVVGEVAKYKLIEAPVEKVYTYWRDFTNFPSFMPNVEEVRPLNGDHLTHWKVSGPAGMSAEWDAEITEDVPNEKIAWRSVEGSKVETNGVVRFDDRDGQTHVEVALSYEPPAGAAGEAVAKLWGEDPSKQVDEALDRFAELARTW